MYNEMYAEALSVPEAIRKVLVNDHVYMQALVLGIANYTALAERIKPDIERLTGSKVNLNTIVVAIKRFADALEKKAEQENSSTHLTAARAKMSLTGSIIDIDFQKENNDNDNEALASVLDEFFEQDSRYNLFQTDSHFSLLTEDADEIRRMVANAIQKFDGKISEGLSKITVSLTPDDKSPYHILSLVANVLYNHQIPIHSAFFTANEIVLILSDSDATKAYDVIRMKLG
ncbi:MAG: hypothetical protein M3286_01805 [Thermoproteota archaeon]|nr:hypothetical protein [Thermoproteota archaeon]